MSNRFILKDSLRFLSLFETKPNSFLKDVISTIIIQILILLLNAAVLKVASIKMSIEDFGLFNIAKRSSTLVAYILLFGLGISIPRFIAKYRSIGEKEGEERILLGGICIIFCFSLLGLLLAVFCKKPLAIILFGNINLTMFVFPLMLNIIGIALSTFVTAYYRGINHLKLFNLIQFLLQLIFLLILITITSNPIKLIEYVGISWIICSIIIFVVTIFQQPLFIKKLAKNQIINGIVELTRFGAPRIIGEFALFGYFALPLIILSSRNELLSVALISVPIAFFQLITSIFGFAGYVLLPHVSAGMVNGNFCFVRKDIKTMEVLYLIGSLGSVLILLIFAPLLTKIFFNSNYLLTVSSTRIMSICLVPYSFYLLYRNPLDAVSNFPWNSINLVIALTIVTISIIFSHSIQGYALAFAGSSCVLGLLSWLTWKKVIKTIAC